MRSALFGYSPALFKMRHATEKRYKYRYFDPAWVPPAEGY